MRTMYRIAVAAAALALSSATHAATITVPDDVATVQAALDAAMAGRHGAACASGRRRITRRSRFRAAATPSTDRSCSPRSRATGRCSTAPGVPATIMVLIDGRSYVQVIGFELRNNLGVHDGSGVRILGAGSHIEIRDNRIHDMRGSDAMGITVYGTEPSADLRPRSSTATRSTTASPCRSEALTLNGNVDRLRGDATTYVRDVNNIGIDFIGGETDIQPDPTKVARNGVVPRQPA